MLKLNTVYPRGGYEVLLTTFEYNFGVRPDHYVNVNRNAFAELVDALGGVDVYVPYPLSDPTFAGGKFSVQAGTVHMDGPTARWYVSSRMTSNDFIRNQRQQTVLKAIFIKLLSIDALHRGEDLYRLYQQYVDTDLRIEDLLPLIPLAAQLSDTNRISRHAIGLDQVTQDRTPIQRAYILVPNQMEVFKVILQAVQP